MSEAARKTPAKKTAGKPGDPNAKPLDTEGLLAQAITGRILKPPRLFIYGVHGIGKSTFAADAPSPIFIQTEEGANEIDVPKLPTCSSHEEVMNYLRALYREKHSYQTVVIDTIDWLEDSIRLDLAKQYTEKELAYGRDALFLEEKMGEVLNALNLVLNRRQMTCILIGHSEVKRFDSPLTESYDRYQPKLAQRASALLQEWADAVLFAGYDVTVTKEDAGFNKKRARGVGQGERVLFTEERPGFLAKNRYGMPEEIMLPKEGGFQQVAQWVPYLQEQLGLANPREAAEDE